MDAQVQFDNNSGNIIGKHKLMFLNCIKLSILLKQINLK